MIFGRLFKNYEIQDGGSKLAIVRNFTDLKYNIFGRAKNPPSLIGIVLANSYRVWVS